MGGPNVFWRATRRTFLDHLQRFAAIAIICALGITMLVGLRSACQDLRAATDVYLREQLVYDIQISSTLGLDDDDIEALSQVEGIAQASGSWAETVYTTVDGGSEKASVYALSDNFNRPSLQAGRLPSAKQEVAVSTRYLRASAHKLGDTITFKNAGPEAQVFERTSYTIVGEILDPTNLSANDETMSWRQASEAAYSFYVDPAAVTADAYTVAYLHLAADAPAFPSAAYDALSAKVAARLDKLAPKREKARTHKLRSDAEAKVDAAEKSAREEIDTAQRTLDQQKAELESGQATLDNAYTQLDGAQTKLDDGQAQLARGKQDLADKLGCTPDNISDTLKTKQQELDAAGEQLFLARNDTSEGASQLEIALGAAWPKESWDKLAGAAYAEEATSAKDAFMRELQAHLEQAAAAQVDVSQEQEGASAQLVAQANQFGEAMVELARQSDELAAAQASLNQATDAFAQLVASEADLASKAKELASGRAELDAQSALLVDGREKLATAQAELDEKSREADKQIADARAKARDIKDAQWYVFERADSPSLSSVGADASSIEAIAAVLPPVFLVVAVLVVLTTMMRIVEEERQISGLLKALGYKGSAIIGRYLVCAMLASAAGIGLGWLGGYVGLPLFLFKIFAVMYSIPSYSLAFYPDIALVSAVIFAGAILGASWYSTYQELKSTPAALMRPQAPRAGKRILLERISFIWRRMSFLGKVCARNLFRFKRRFFMSVFGIAGCCGLLIMGFGIRDTVHALPEREYGDQGVLAYDLLVVTHPEDLDATDAKLRSDTDTARVSQGIKLLYTSANIADTDNTVQLIVVPDKTNLSSYLRLHGSDDTSFETDGDEVALIGRGLEQNSGIAAGDTIVLQEPSIGTTQVRVSGVFENYLGDYVILSESCFERIFGQVPRPNAAMYVLDGPAQSQIERAEEVAEWSGVLAVVATSQLMRDFSSAFTLINAVVVVIIGLAAALSITVVYTLSTTNISERQRELATIKVLGFFRSETHHYVNRETYTLSLIGLLCGVVLGYGLSRCLTWILKMPGMYFDVVVRPESYLLACSLTFVFTIIVSWITNRALDRIDMVGALKSAE